MLGRWTELLPLFVVRWLALRYCERLTDGMATRALARPDVMFRVPMPAIGCAKTGNDE